MEEGDLVQLNWTEAYKKWQYIEVFNIGKAEQIMFNLTMNTFPVSKERVDSNIENEKTDLTNPNDWAAQGFPAIDYMLHGIADNKESVIEIYNSNTKYSGYLNTLVSTMSSNTDIVVEDWETYKDKISKSKFLQTKYINQSNHQNSFPYNNTKLVSNLQTRIFH